jgi:hypothetical protein
MQVNDLVETLEKLVDSQQDGLLHVLTALEIMCGEKAGHIRADWQDDVTAQTWDAAAKMIGRTVRHIEPLNI